MPPPGEKKKYSQRELVENQSFMKKKLMLTHGYYLLFTAFRPAEVVDKRLM